MKAKLIGKVKKIAAVATGALFVGATLGMASVFASGLSSLPGPFVSNGHVNAVFVVGANAAPTDILGAIDVSAALTASAAATHSSVSTGQVTIGTLVLSSKAKSVNTFASNGTALNAISPSVNLVDTNFTSGKYNYTSVENLSFVKQATFNGLNVEFPVGSYELLSYIVNRTANDGKVALGKNLLDLNSTVATMANVTYTLGNSVESVLSINKTTAQFGTTKVFSSIKLPSTLTVGPNNVNLEGLVTFTGKNAAASYNQLEVSVNGGATTYINFSTPTTVGPVTINPGSGLLTNSTGSYLRSLTISSIAYKQLINNSKAVLPGLSAFNVTNTSTEFVSTSTTSFMLPHSFTGTSSYNLPENLTSIDLEKLVPVYASPASNVTLTVGHAKYDNITVNVPAKVNTSATAVNVASAVPNIGVGAGALFTSSVDVPSEILLGNGTTATNTVKLTNILANDTLLYSVGGKSGDVAPGIVGITNGVALAFSSLSTSPAGVLGLAITNATKEMTSSAFTPYVNTTGSSPLVFYRLPNGEFLGLHYNSTKVTIANASTITADDINYIVNFTASSTSSYTNTTVKYANGKPFSMNYGGYNVTVTPFRIRNVSGTAYFGNVSIRAPVASLSDGYSLVPGFSGLYASNDSLFSSVKNSNLGSFTFNGQTLNYTDPLGEVLTANVKSYTNGTTYFAAPTNTSPNTWGDYLHFTTKNTVADFVVPTENYTVAVAGSQVVSGQVNYTIGQTVSAGELLGISGVSTVSASQLLNNNVDLTTLDSNFTGATNDVPVIVVGGPAVNTLAESLLNLTAPVYGSKFTNLTGVGANEAVIEMFNNVTAFNSQPALWVAGYSGQDTLEAAEVLASSLIGQPIVNLTGNKVILSTSSSTYKGVTVAS